jgi:hypothetical protein
MILEFAIEGIEDSFDFVQAISLRNSPIGQVVYCRSVNFEDRIDYMDFGSARRIYVFEEWINKPNRPTSNPIHTPTIVERDDMFDILITPADNNLLLAVSACLFSDVTLPDTISRIGQGECRLCDSSRVVRAGPSCIGMEGQDFRILDSCTLCCPHCIGVEFFLENKGLYETYYLTLVPKEDQKSFEDWFRQRAKELDYYSRDR